ncbi:hypothetical protein OG21DRAFT_648147 [Imleria badia]|nr:hypothetical protein OG21DRAFT_648147 [Imleria badia]
MAYNPLASSYESSTDSIPHHYTSPLPARLRHLPFHSPSQTASLYLITTSCITSQQILAYYMLFRRIFIPITRQTNVSGVQYGLEEEASESIWGSSNLTISHLGTDGELHIQSGHQSAGHLR